MGGWGIIWGTIIYIITLLLSLSMLKHPTYVSLNFHLREVESESAGKVSRSYKGCCRRDWVRDKDSAFVVTSSSCGWRGIIIIVREVGSLFLLLLYVLIR